MKCIFYSRQNDEDDTDEEWKFSKDDDDSTDGDSEYEKESSRGPVYKHQMRQVAAVSFVSYPNSKSADSLRLHLNQNLPPPPTELMQGKDFWSSEGRDKENSRACEVSQTD